jgi:transposase
LTNIQRERLPPLLPPQKPTIGRPAHDHRTILKGILRLLRTGARWRDLPARYGPWRTVASRFSRWQRAGVFPHLLAILQQQAEAVGQVDWTMHLVYCLLLSTSRPHKQKGVPMIPCKNCHQHETVKNAYVRAKQRYKWKGCG